MRKIIIIGCYFGTLRVDAQLFIKSIEANPTIDWLIFSDCKWGMVPPNMKVVNVSFEDLRDQIQSKFDFTICLEAPYKLCDFRPAYGDIFQSYICQYDFWGHCDFDMVFGNLRNFFTEDKLNHYDRIYYQGHLSLYRNTRKINNLYKSDKGKLYYKDVFSSPLARVFDEVDGMYHIFVNEKVPIYSEVEYIDVVPYLNRMLHPRNGYNISKKYPMNYCKQVFGYENGSVYKWFINEQKVEKVEFAYIHYSHKEFKPIDSDNFFFNRKGLVAADQEMIPFESYRRGIDELQISMAQFIYRVKRKIKKLKMEKSFLKRRNSRYY